MKTASTVLGMTLERDDLERAARGLVPIANELQRLSPMLAQRVKAIASECEADAANLTGIIAQRGGR